MGRVGGVCMRRLPTRFGSKPGHRRWRNNGREDAHRTEPRLRGLLLERPPEQHPAEWSGKVLPGLLPLSLEAAERLGQAEKTW